MWDFNIANVVLSFWKRGWCLWFQHGICIKKFYTSLTGNIFIALPFKSFCFPQSWNSHIWKLFFPSLWDGYDDIEQKLLMDTSPIKMLWKVPSAWSRALYHSCCNSPWIQELSYSGMCALSSTAKGLDFSKQSSDCEFNFDFLQWLKDEVFLCFKCAVLWKPQVQSWVQKDWHLQVRKALC